MLEDCPHIMWWDQKQELLKDNEADKDITPEILAGMHFPLRARHFFKPCAEGPCAHGEMVVTQRESRVAGGHPVVEVKHGPQFVRCTMCAKVLCTKCAEPIKLLQKKCLIRKVWWRRGPVL